MTVSPTQLTLRQLRADGWLAAVVEHWNPHARIRQDLYGFIDVIAIRPGQTLAVQATTAPVKPEPFGDKDACQTCWEAICYGE